jgi:hypothetical protein
MGVRATYSMADTLAATAFWVAGWNANVVDGNGMRTLRRPRNVPKFDRAYSHGIRS